MKTKGFKGRDFIAETDFTPQEIKTIIEVAEELKKQFESVQDGDLVADHQAFRNEPQNLGACRRVGVESRAWI